MYKITIDNGGVQTVIHNGKSDDSAARIKGGQLTEEVNASPGFTFAIYPSNPGYGDIQGMYTKITVKDITKSRDIFIGRVLTVTDSMDEQGKICKTVTCKGEMDYFYDSIQTYRKFTSGALSNYVLNAIVSEHNSIVGTDKQFTVGQCETMGLPEAVEIDDGTVTMEALKTIMVDTFGGEIRVRNENGVRYIDFVQRFGKKSNTEIKLAVNMKSITQTKDPTSIITRLIPFGGTKSNGSRLTIETAPSAMGKKYIDNTELINKYGIICGTVTFDDIVGEGAEESAAAVRLYNKSKAYMDTVNTELRQYQITALDLSKISEDFDEFELGNRHIVKNRLMGIDEELRIIKRTLSIDEPQKSVLTFGDKFETLTGFTAKQGKQTEKMIKQSSQEIRNSMQSTVDYITGGNGGYVVQKFNDVGQPIATWYTDNLDTSQANEMLIINNRGILGSTDGGKTYNTAIDIRGNINASMITAGILQGIKIICNDATITGGSINIETNSEKYSVIKLNCGDWSMELSPLEMVFKNSTINENIRVQAGGMFFNYGTEQKMTISPQGIITGRTNNNVSFQLVADRHTFTLYNSSGDATVVLNGETGTIWTKGG